MKFLFATALLGILVSFTLAFINKHQKKANKLLAICFFSISCFILDIAFINSHFLLKFQFPFHLLLPFQYLIAPASYLYVRGLLKGNIRFRKMDSLHFLPALIILLEYLPFYFSSSQFKLSAINAATQNFAFQFQERDAYFPFYVQCFLKTTMASTYLYLQWQLIKAWKTEIITAPNVYKDIFKWLQIFTIFITTFWLLYVVEDVISILKLSNKSILLFEYVLCCCFLSTLLYLFFRPKILFGMMGNIVFYDLEYQPKAQKIIQQETEIGLCREIEPVTDVLVNDIALQPALSSIICTETRLEDTTKIADLCQEIEKFSNNYKNLETKVFCLTPEKINFYKQQLESLMDQKVFLKQGCCLKDICQLLNIPRHHMSIIINSEYRVNFNDFINHYRIDYLKIKMLESGSNQLTLDGLAKEAGFSSRATFFRAFTKFTGKVPSDFLKNK